MAIKNAYFQAKWLWYVDKKLGQMKLTMRDVEIERQHAEQYDEWIEQRLEYMYSYLDYDNNRHRLREKFANEMHKKTSLQDVGEKLDEFILDSKAKQADYWHADKHLLEQPDKAK